MANSHRDNLHALVTRISRDRADLHGSLLVDGYDHHEAYAITDALIPSPWDTLGVEDWRRAFYAPKHKRIGYHLRNVRARAASRAACHDARYGDYHRADTLDPQTTVWWD